jgi:hypothetical protein
MRRLQETSSFPTLRNAILTGIVKRIAHQDANLGGFTPVDMFSSHDLTKLTDGLLTGLFGFLESLGSIASIFVACSIIMFAIKTIAEAIIFGRLLSGIFNCGLVFVASIWTSLGHALLIQHERFVQTRGLPDALNIGDPESADTVASPSTHQRYFRPDSNLRLPSIPRSTSLQPLSPELQRLLATLQQADETMPSAAPRPCAARPTFLPLQPQQPPPPPMSNALLRYTDEVAAYFIEDWEVPLTKILALLNHLDFNPSAINFNQKLLFDRYDVACLSFNLAMFISTFDHIHATTANITSKELGPSSKCWPLCEHLHFLKMSNPNRVAVIDSYAPRFDFPPTRNWYIFDHPWLTRKKCHALNCD